MKASYLLALLGVVTSCSSQITSNPAAATMHQQHEQLLTLQKALPTQIAYIDQTSFAKLADIVAESKATIKEVDNLDTSKWQESEQLGLVNQLALKEGILLLAAQQVQDHALSPANR